MPQINPERFLADLTHLRTFGAEGIGVVRPSLSDPDVAARRWLRDRMEDAGLDAVIDGVGTVFGRSTRTGPVLLLGSHTDTQPRGGWLDGAFGVIAALEVVRAMAEDPTTSHLAVDAASWIDEEGTFLGFLGARSFCGLQDLSLIETAHDQTGRRLTDALDAAGLTGLPRVEVEAGRHVGYLEAHIEQGPYLEAGGHRIGVVTGIVGIRTMKVRFTGVQNHAGTTPMPMRKDAGRALVEFVSRVHAEFPALAEARTVWTVGRIDLDPGASSIIPGSADLTLQFRDADADVMDRLEEKVFALAGKADGDIAVDAWVQHDTVEPAPTDERLQSHIADAAEVHAAGDWIHMPSGAGHDAQVLATVMPAAMVFVPSIGGISHDFAENTSDDDLVLGCQVLATASASILTSS